MQMSQSRTGPSWVCLSALAGAGAALVLPGATSTTSAGAALLAVGALALLAGHTWGLLVSIPTHVTLVGRVWPTLVHAQTETTWSCAAVAVVLVTALPALALTSVVLPEIARHLLPTEARRARAILVASAAVGLVFALVLPAFVV